MFCPKCGKNLLENEDFCPNCGTNIKQIQELSNETNISNTIKTKESSIFTKYKKQILIAIGCLILALIGIFLYVKFIGFEVLSWDDSYLDSKTEFITQTKLKLGVKFSDKNNIDKIKYETTCGTVEANGLEVTWNLLNVTGNCEISASYKLKKTKKEIKVIPFDLKENDLSLEYTIEEDSDEDLDLDGLTNKQEKEYKTDPTLADTDLDGLDDYYEIFTSKTDPNKKDSDNDGLNDYDEIELGLDPNKSDSKNDGIKDGERTLTYNYNSDKLKLSITGKGNIASTVTEINSNTKISSKTGLIDNLYTLYTDGTIESATLTISYTDEELKKFGLNEDNLSIYYYNEQELKYEKLDSKIDKNNKTVTAKLNHFSNYVLGDSSLLKKSSTSQVLFVLDNSWSMYSKEDYEKYTKTKYNGGLFGTTELESDPKGLRFSLTSNLITKLATKNYQIGLSEFRGDYANAFKIGSDAGKIKEKLSSMKGNFITSIAGTNIGIALTKSIGEFSKDSDNKYIILLTDGEDLTLKNRTKKIIEESLANNIKICSIGFGKGTNNNELSNISNATGCKFYSSTNASGLAELFDNIKAQLDDNLVDINNDNKPDGILLADSGFIVNRDGFSFVNYGSNLSKGGHCYGMATFAELYYKKVLPLKHGAITADKNSSYSYDLTPYFKNHNYLYNYKLKTNILKYTFGFDYFGENQPSDLRILSDKTLAFNDKYKKELSDSGIYDIVENKSTKSKKEQLKNYGVNYKTGESAYLNEDKMQTSQLVNNGDLQLLNAIYAAFIKQNVTSYYSSATDFTLWMRNQIDTESSKFKGADGFINILKTRLNNKDVPVIFSNFNGGLHAINAISLVQDIDNPNYYYIGVYDNNYPGEKRYVDVECKKNKCVTKANKYYSKEDKSIRITPSLEYDLEYYK